MFKKLVQKRNTILIIFACILAIFLLLTLIFSNSEEKFRLMIISVVAPWLFYGGLRLAFTASRIYGSLKYIKLGVRFFFFVSALAIPVSFVSFILNFPNGLSPTLFIFMAIFICVLDEEKKNIKIEAEKEQEN